MPSGFAGVLGDILVTAPPSVTLADVAYTDSGDHTTYTINDQTKRYLDPLTATVVQTSPDGVTWTTVTLYTIAAVGAKIVFNSANPSGTQVRLHSGKYFPYASVGNTTDWQWQGQNVFQESTSHQGVGGSTWSTFLPVLTTGKVTLKKWWVDNTMLSHLTARDLLIVSCVTPDSHRWEAFCYISQSNLMQSASKLTEVDLTFQLTGQLYPV